MAASPCLLATSNYRLFNLVMICKILGASATEAVEVFEESLWIQNKEDLHMELNGGGAAFYISVCNLVGRGNSL